MTVDSDGPSDRRRSRIARRRSQPAAPTRGASTSIRARRFRSAIAFAILAVSIWLVRVDPAHAGAHRDRVAARVRADAARRGAAPPHRLEAALRGRDRAGRRRRDRDHDDRAGRWCRRSTRCARSTRTFRRPSTNSATSRSSARACARPNASKKVRQWLDDFPKRLDVNTTPIANAASTIADGIVATFFALLLAITLVLDGERS